MESVFEMILTNAGLAGAILVVCGYVLWKKDLQVKELQAAAVTCEQEIGGKMERLTTDSTVLAR